MSTNSECHLIEVKPAEWWWVLEDYNAPKNAWDWREYATADGPFKTSEMAWNDMRRGHANPGSSCECPYEEGYEPDEVMQRLMDEAKERRKSLSRYRW